MGLVNTIIGGGMQLALGAMNNAWAEQAQATARQENYKYGEMAADNADKRTRALYNDFYSPQALMNQYKAAGLSPSMMFGGTPGQGGSSGAQGTGAAGPGALYSPISVIEGAQAAALMAQADKTKAETKSIEEQREPTTKKLMEEAANLAEDTNNKRLQGAVLALQYDYDQISYAIHAATGEKQIQLVNEQVESIKWNNKILKEQLEIARATGKKEQGTIQAVIEKANMEVQNLMSDLLTKELDRTDTQAKIALTRQQKKAIVAGVVLDLYNAKLKNKEYKLDKDKLDAQVGQWLKQNDIEGRKLDLKEIEIVLQQVQQSGNFLTNLVDAIIPF